MPQLQHFKNMYKKNDDDENSIKLCINQHWKINDVQHELLLLCLQIYYQKKRRKEKTNIKTI